VDSTIVGADASMNSIVELSLPAADYWRELDEEEAVKGPAGRKPKDGEAAQVGKPFSGEVDVEKMGKRRRARNAAYLRKRSTTDPEATLHWRPGYGAFLSYKAHIAADTSGVITALAVSPSAEHDTTKLPELIDRHAQNLGTPDALAADTHYGSDEEIAFLQGKGIKTAIPPTGRRKETQRFSRDAFTYDEVNDRFTCPAGKTLRRKRKSKTRDRISYLARAGDCAACEIRSRCMGKSTAEARMVTRVDDPTLERAEQFRRSERGRNLSLLRHTVIEGLFGEAKTFHGLSRAKFRGLEKMEIQALLTATAPNLKKLVRNSMTEKILVSVLIAYAGSATHKIGSAVGIFKRLRQQAHLCVVSL